MNEKTTKKNILRVNIVLTLEEDPELHEHIHHLCVEHRLGRMTEQLIHDAVQEGAIVEEIRAGRADIEIREQ